MNELIKNRQWLAALVLLLSAALVGCQPVASAADPQRSTPAGAAKATWPEATFIAKDYRFTGPETVPAGVTNIRLHNQGDDAHHIQLLKLADGKSFTDLEAVLKESPAWPAWARPYGGPNAVFPGASSSAYANLDAGAYAVLSWVPDKDQGLPQYRRGMIRPLLVTEATGESILQQPSPDITLDLLDYSFVLSQTPTAGEQLIRVTNKGPHTHEVVLVKLPNDGTAMDFVLSLNTGEIKGELAGGVTEIAPGMENTFLATFEPGVRYGLLCFVVDHETGNVHFMNGMIQDFIVE